LAISLGAKKVLVSADYDCIAVVRCFDRVRRRIGSCALHLHDILETFEAIYLEADGHKMSSSSNMKRIEKFFSFLGVACQMVGATFLVLVLGHYLLGGAASLYNYFGTGNSGRVDARYKSPVYDNDPDKIAYWEEFNRAWGAHFEPYVHWKRNPFSGRFINVDEDGVRRTVKGTPTEHSKKVFMFGGSTMWGTGSPDGQTIPSFVQSLLGDGYDVDNYGDTAYVSTQELNALLLLLAQGKVPDVVVFYDGVNDGYAGAYSPAIPRDPHNLRLRDRVDRPIVVDLIRRSNYKDFFKLFIGNRKFAAWEEKIAPLIPEKSLAVIDAYEAHIRQVNALGREYGFKACFFWQPNLSSMSRTDFPPYEQGILDGESPTFMASQKAVYEVARERFSRREDENIFFLGGIFDETDQPIYIDWHHVGPVGNDILAREMIQCVTSSEAGNNRQLIQKLSLN
jgi:lysophospholipase L1-like esterase